MDHLNRHNLYRQGLLLLALALSMMLSLFIMQPARAQSDDIEATLEPQEMVRGETTTLRIRVFGQQGGVTIDLDPLRAQFDIISSRSSSHLRSVNGQIESWTDYILILFPRELGDIEVPSIAVGNQQTPAFTINVGEMPNNGLDSGQEVYLEAVVNKESVYVQEQVLFTIRLYYTIAGIRNPHFTEIDPENSVIQQLGQPHQYERLIDGVRYGVYEKNYVIFPQRSGNLSIPDIVFRGELTDGSSSFVFRQRNVRPVTAFATGYDIEVKERPAAFPADATWLPASNLQIEEAWIGDLDELEPGDAVEREVTVTANGLDGPALPPMAPGEIDTVNMYPNPSDVDRRIQDGNVVGTRMESFELVMTEAGEVTVPAMEIPWWDTDTDTLQYARLPATTIQVHATGSPESTDPEELLAQMAGQNAGQASDPLMVPRQTESWILYTLTTVIAVILLAMWWLWRRRLQQLALLAANPEPARQPAYQRQINADAEGEAFNELLNAIKIGDAQQIRIRLIAWGRQFYQDPGLYNLDALADRLDSAALQSEFRKLQASLYASAASTHATTQGDDGHDADAGEKGNEPASATNSASATAWKTLQDELLALRSSRNLKQQQHDAKYALPPLYRL